MASFKRIIEALLIFMSGVLFTYWTYPFFSALIGALDNDAAANPSIFSDWTFISGICWLGLIGIWILWIIILPMRTVFNDDAPQGG